MPTGTSREGTSADCVPEAGSWSSQGGRAVWTSVDAGLSSAKERLGRLARTLEEDVIPRLVQLHRAPLSGENTPAVAEPSAAEVESFVDRVVDGSEPRVADALAGFRERGLSVERIYLELLAPAARHLGVMWTEDRCDFSTVTVGLGRLQRLMRELSPAFGTEVEHPDNGRRVLLCQPDDEQHSFGLSMVAEFFRRGGWDVQGGPAGSGVDPVACVRQDWFDVVGFSVGSERRLDWLTSRIAAVRRASRNSAVLVIVGGPIFTLHPEWAAQVGADGAPVDGARSPQVCEAMLASRTDSEEGAPIRPVR